MPSVEVTGHLPGHTPSPQPSDSPSTPATSTQPAGVACGRDTAGRLHAAGDANAGQDAALCAGDPCATNTQATGVPQQQTVLLQRDAERALRLAGDQCRPTPLRKPIVTAAMVWEQVRRLLPKAAIGLAPRTTTLVNLQTIMWIDAGRQQDLPPLTLLGKQVTVNITLTTVRWDFGDDETDDADGPGKPYDKTNDPCKTKQCPHYYGHTYTRTGSMTITATAGYHATFQVAGGPAVDIPGGIDGPTAAATILVREARAVLVPDPTPN